MHNSVICSKQGKVVAQKLHFKDFKNLATITKSHEVDNVKIDVNLTSLGSVSELINFLQGVITSFPEEKAKTKKKGKTEKSESEEKGE